jgi:hypothetical protein
VHSIKWTNLNGILGRSVFLSTCFDLLCALAAGTVAATLVYVLCTAGGANANLLGWATISTWFGTFLCVHIYREVFI